LILFAKKSKKKKTLLRLAKSIVSPGFLVIFISAPSIPPVSAKKQMKSIVPAGPNICDTIKEVERIDIKVNFIPNLYAMSIKGTALNAESKFPMNGIGKHENIITERAHKSAPCVSSLLFEKVIKTRFLK